MEESWVEKTERLEREYQARIDRLREELDCGQDGPCVRSPGCNRHWEERNRELVQRVAELERDNTRMKNAEVVRGHTEEFSRQLLAELDEVKAARSRLLGVNEQLCKEKSALSDKVMALQSQLEAKDKRVAELDAMNATLAAKLSELESRFTRRVSELKSQLAWTPVSAGLPTEPGVYAFGDPEQGNSSLVFWSLTGLTTTHRWWFSGTSYVSPLEHHHDVTHYRRIELPKDGES